MRQYREALEAAARTHFQGELMNCMSLANDAVYTMADSTLTRTGGNFGAERPEGHGLHAYTNAQAGLFLGNLLQPDWDTFRSGHASGSFHAATRAVSGGPVYVCDGPGEQNFDLLRKLVLSDGTILRAQEPARPTRDCLFADPCREEVLLKIFNRNLFGGVVGAFNCQYHEDRGHRHFIAGSISPQDVEGLPGEDFAMYSHQGQKLVRCGLRGRISLWLTELGWEIVTIVPIVQGLAPIGLADRLNSGAAVTGVQHDGNDSLVALRDGGEFVAWCDDEPVSVTAGDERWALQYDRRTKLLRVRVEHRGPCVLRITLDRDGTAARGVRQTGRWRPVTPDPGNRLFRVDGAAP